MRFFDLYKSIKESSRVDKRFLGQLCIFLLVIFALWLPRGIALDRYVTVDEPKWLLRSANFYQALSQMHFEDTFQREHPGVTITWAGTASFFVRFREYITLGPPQIERVAKLQVYLRNHLKSPMLLLETGRIFVVLFIILVLTLAFASAVQLVGLTPALLGFLFIAFDPFSVSLSRLLHLDGLASALMLLSLLAFMQYLYRDRRLTPLIISGVAAGLAWLTKAPAFFLVPFAGLLLTIEMMQVWRTKRIFGWRVFVPLIVWGGIASAVFVLFWPAMWVDPIGSLSRVFSYASGYLTEGHESAIFFNGMIYSDGRAPWYFYPVAYLWRTTPPVLIGLCLAVFSFILPNRQRQHQHVILILGLFTLLFALFMTMGGKKFDRYLLPVQAPLALIASLGWVAFFEFLLASVFRHLKPAARLVGTSAAIGIVVLAQLVGIFQTSPYFFSYYNPLMGGSSRALDAMMIGYGEGLDLAAQYLNGLPEAANLRVISWYGEGCFSYLFKGTTIELDLDINTRALKKADYAVLYVSQLQRKFPGPEVLAYFQQLTPEYVGRINDLPYVFVYNLQNAPEFSFP